MRALRNRIILHAGTEYRLTAGAEVPDMPERLLNTLIRAKHVEEPPAPERAAKSKKPKSGKETKREG